MKLKTKLITTIISSCLVLCLGVIGIFAVKTLNMSVGGNISFTADGITATISQGYLYNSAGTKYADSDVFVTGGTSEDMQPIKITNDKKESEYTSLIATWANLDLKFNPAGDDIVLKFTITNTMSAKTLPVEVTANEGVDKNNNITLTVAPTTTDPIAASGSREYSITFHISDKSVNASLTGFNIEFVLGTVPVTFDMQQTDTTHGNATYQINEQTKTVTLSTTLTTNSAFLGWAKDSEENIVAGALTTSVPYETATYYPVYESVSNLNMNITTNSDNTYTFTLKDWYNTDILVIPSVINVGGQFYTITEIKESMFNKRSDAEGSSIGGIVIPETITEIPAYAFSYCQNFRYIYISASVTKIGENIFSGIVNNNIEIIVSEQNPIYDSRENCNAIIETASNRLIIGRAKTVIPDTVITLASGAFFMCNGMESITIPKNVEIIEERCGTQWFDLKTVIFESTVPPTIGSNCFDTMSSKFTAYVPDESLSLYQTALSNTYCDVKPVSEFN